MMVNVFRSNKNVHLLNVPKMSTLLSLNQRTGVDLNTISLMMPINAVILNTMVIMGMKFLPSMLIGVGGVGVNMALTRPYPR